MIPVAEADRILAEDAWVLPIEEVALTGSYGRVLRAPLTTDRDLPPYDRATMDGIAIASRALGVGRTRFSVEADVLAGQPASTLADESRCVRIMTGAVVPRGADQVIKSEDIDMADGTALVSAAVGAAQWSNVHRSGSDGRSGSTVLTPGVRIAEREAAVIASVGAARVRVSRLPRVAIMTTGDEVLPIEADVLPHQIRQSNRYAAEAILAGASLPSSSEHQPDDESLLHARTMALLDENDVLITTGAVSMGVTDRMPDVLRGAGVQERFHHLSQRPGKPMWFGVGARRGGQVAAFGLPGNPVSVAVCLRRYVLPFLFRMLDTRRPPTESAVLGDAVRFAAPLTYYLPVALDARSGTLIATPRPTGGSGDFLSLMASDGFMELPPNRGEFEVGHIAPVYRWGARGA